MERHHRAGSMVSFSVQVGNDIFFRFYLTKAELFIFTEQKSLFPFLPSLRNMTFRQL